MVGGYHGYQHYVAQNEWSKANIAKNIQDMSFWNQASHNHGEWISTALMNGLIWPIPVVIAVSLGWLVFKKINTPRRTQQ
jgi:hypothetical protein